MADELQFIFPKVIPNAVPMLKPVAVPPIVYVDAALKAHGVALPPGIGLNAD